MAGSFSGDGTFAGPIEPAQDSTKIAAAKRAVLKEIASLPDCLVSVITFADEAQLLCQGSAKHTDLFQSSLRQIIPGGRTNLADAMLLALRQARGFSGNDTAILIISDARSEDAGLAPRLEDVDLAICEYCFMALSWHAAHSSSGQTFAHSKERRIVVLKVEGFESHAATGQLPGNAPRLPAVRSV